MSALLIETNGNYSIISMNDISKEKLYKKCGYRKDTKFKLLTEIHINKEEVLELWGKTNGREINLFQFTNNLSKLKISGNCILIKINIINKTILEITESEIEYIITKDKEEINYNEDYNSELEQEEYIYSSEEEK